MTKARDIASASPAPSTVSATEIGYLDGVTSAIQTQIDSKIGSASAISPTLIDAKGDLIVGSAADTAARLAVGTNNYVLTADSAATNGVKWAAAAAGGMTLLSTTSMSGSSSITLSNISQDYIDLYILIQQFQTSIGTGGQLRIATNGTTNIASGMQMSAADYGTPSLSGYAGDYIKTGTINPADDGKTGVLLQFFNYCGSWQGRRFYQLYANNGDTTNGDGLFTTGIVRTNAAITSLVISQSNGGTFNNGTIYLYGVK